jgi:cell fate regulator YaaT (PSP1 superfamily)
MMGESEYLVGYGGAGEFGRFRPTQPMACERGDRVVVRTHRGIEAGQVLRLAAAGHARFLPNTTVGQLLRQFNAADARAEASLRTRAGVVCDRASQLAKETGLPLVVLDVEVLLDGEHVVLHHLSGADCDVRPFVSALSREFSLHVLLEDLARHGNEPMHEDEEGADHQCGSCGSDGGCGSCGSSGGCGSCSSKKTDDAVVFAGLRDQMERQRMSLL